MGGILRDVERSPAWKGKFTLETLSWDDPDAPAPMDAHLSPQQAVDRGLGLPSTCDLVVVIFWRRMGTPLAEPRKPDGSAYLAGTEYELAEALAADPSPRILLYRRTDSPAAEDEQAADQEKLRQYELVTEFFDRFGRSGGTLTNSYTTYETIDGFRDRFRKDIEGLLRQFEEEGTAGPGPPLELTTYERDHWTRLHFRARGAPLLGRSRELRRLEDFLESDRAFCWWIITGAGGAGKSRLALEVGLEKRKLWRVGFLPADHGFDRWHDWQPRRPTLVIVDYVIRRADEIRRIISALSMRGMPPRQPLRLLLLEREATESAPWWKKFQGTGSEALALRGAQHDEPLLLEPLGDDDLWSILEHIIKAEGRSALPKRKETIEALVAIDPERQPLFAALAADALAHREVSAPGIGTGCYRIFWRAKTSSSGGPRA